MFTEKTLVNLKSVLLNTDQVPTSLLKLERWSTPINKLWLNIFLEARAGQMTCKMIASEILLRAVVAAAEIT